jgi:hypothetical protein
MHLNLAEFYRHEVEHLDEALLDPTAMKPS